MTAADKKFLHDLHDKHYGKGAKKKREKVDTVSSRHDLMLQARDKGVKNYRVLNKAELAEVVKEKTTKARIDEIVKGAVARWKSGWGKRKKTITTKELGKVCTEALTKATS